MRTTIACDRCGKEFSCYPAEIRDGRRFCSEKCFYEWLKEYERADYVDVNCLTCNKPLHVLKSRYDDGRGKYCSQKCMIEQRPKKPKCVKIKCTCLHCGKEFEIYPSWIKNGGGKFCSRNCTAAYYKRRARLNSPTSIEKALMNELDRRHIVYVSQYPMRGWVIDIAIPERHLAIEADGTYWHSLDNVKEKDIRKNNDLASVGWTVIHLAEHDIVSSPCKCVDEIVKHL